MTNQNKVTVINLAHEVSDAAVERVRRLVDNVLSRNPNWSGAEIEIERDDFTWVDCSDELDGSMLLASVVRAIDGERD